MARTTSNALPHTAILFHPEGKEAPELGELRDRLVSAGWKTFAVDLRNTGESQWDFERIHGNYVALRDIVTHQISLWLGRPLMGQWVWDVRRCVDFIARDEDSGHVAVIGFGDTGLAAILEAGDDPRVDAVVTVGSLASFVSPNGFGKPWRKWTTDPCMPMRNAAAFVPNLFWKVADWPQLAAMACPRPLLIANPESGDKTPMSDADAKSTFSWTRSVYVVHDSSARFDTRTGATTDDIASWLEQAPFTNHEP